MTPVLYILEKNYYINIIKDENAEIYGTQGAGENLSVLANKNEEKLKIGG